MKAANRQSIRKLLVLLVIASVVTCSANGLGTRAPVAATLQPQVMVVEGCLPPTPFDLDGDGVIDALEFAVGTDPRDCDSDDDGRPDSELFSGSDPLTAEAGIDAGGARAALAMPH